MKVEWKTFLGEFGAEFGDNDKVLSYGNLDRERKVALSGNVFADLSHYALVAVHGDDAESFLQGQFSNDVRLVDEKHSLLNAYCSPKGRMLASFRLFAHGDSYYLKIPESMVEATIKRLRMYVMRAQVTFEDTVDTFIPIGISGPDAIDELTKAIGFAPPDNVNEVVQKDDLTIIRIAGTHPRFEVYAGFDTACKIWNALNVHCAPIGASPWNILEIHAGLPTIYPETTEAFVPQMANLQLVEGVSFKKGCYPGQEVVARMQYLGKLKRRMYLCQIEGETSPTIGQECFDAKGDEQAVGKVVDTEPHPDGGYSLLVVLQIAKAEAGEIHLGSKAGPALKFLPLPYEYEEAQES